MKFLPLQKYTTWQGLS